LEFEEMGQMPWKMSAPWVLIRQLREIMASSSEPQAKLDRIVRVIAANMVAEVSSIYVRLADGSLELVATEGLRPEAVHRLKMAKREGLVGLIAEWGEPINLPEAQKHPAFSYKPETGEEIYRAFLGVPIVRERRTLGVLTVQNKRERKYSGEEVEALQTTAMVLAEMIASGALSPTTANGTERRTASVTLSGVPVTEGLALGHIVLHEPRVHIEKVFAESIVEEIQRLEDAVAELRRVIDSLMHKGEPARAGEHREILETVRMLAHDRGWARRMKDAISAGLTAEAAVERVQHNMRTQFMRHADPFWRERLHDLDDLANRLLRILSGRGDSLASEKLPEDTILVARNMGPAELLEYDRSKLRGLVIEDGGATSHVAIVARSFGIAALVQTRDVLATVEAGDTAVLDAETGDLHVRPSLELIRAYADKERFRRKRQKQFEALKDIPALTQDGVRISLNMNAGLLVDMPNFHISGADGIGLFRTELQFMISSTFPRMNQQQAAYERVLNEAKGKPVTFRSLDVGGDKVLPYLSAAKEENPAMGWRAVRISLDRPALFRTQIRALLRAAAGRDLHVMIPFVTEVQEFIAARALIDMEIAQARKFGHELPAAVKVGVMLEVPALAWQLDALMPLVDFVSVGSNDLIQFLNAADRDNAQVARRFDSLGLAVLCLLREVVLKAEKYGVALSLCGEMAGRPVEALALIGLGFRSISMAPASIGPVKTMILSADAGAARDFMAKLLDNHCMNIRAELEHFADESGVRL
jgi:phosphotransferase system enzyme I (PtsP)